MRFTLVVAIPPPKIRLNTPTSYRTMVHALASESRVMRLRRSTSGALWYPQRTHRIMCGSFGIGARHERQARPLIGSSDLGQLLCLKATELLCTLASKHNFAIVAAFGFHHSMVELRRAIAELEEVLRFSRVWKLKRKGSSAHSMDRLVFFGLRRMNPPISHCPSKVK